MDPISIAALIGTLGTIATAVLAYIQYRRTKRENLAQSEVDQLKSNIEHPTTGGDKLFLGPPKAP
jgi:uncharacterized membrane protein